MPAKRVFLALPATAYVGLTTATLGLLRALDRHGVRVAFLKPIAQPSEGDPSLDRSVAFVRSSTLLQPPGPIPVEEARARLSKGQAEDLMEEVVQLADQARSDARADVIVAEGLIQTAAFPFAPKLNQMVARALSAEIVLVTKPEGEGLETLGRQLAAAASEFGGFQSGRVAGALLNLADLGTAANIGFEGDSFQALAAFVRQGCPPFASGQLDLVGIAPRDPRLLAPRMADVARVVGAVPLVEGEIRGRRVLDIQLLARSVPNLLHVFKPGNLLVTPCDREDVILAVALAAINGVRLAGLILTGESEPDPNIMQLCRRAWSTGLPVLWAKNNSFETAQALGGMNPEIPIDDAERIAMAMDVVATSVDPEWIRRRLASEVKARLSPPAFRHFLARSARADPKRIALPEGEEPRTIQAAVACAHRGIAWPVLLGSAPAIRDQAAALGLSLPETVSIVEPDPIRDRYVPGFVERRRHKNITPGQARDQLEDNVVLATMMLAQDEVDGLVSGAVHSSANTVRPALQLIKTHPGARVVSSIFFMCLPDQVLVYGDCAINTDPDAETLADIALQSAASAKAFGIEPVVAMISYSTHGSGSGADVDKVAAATARARQLQPGLVIDGPLQYDAAAIADVARAKAPDSPVAGRANVFIFPDLNTGNTTYKAVQRAANVVSIGPMLQGLDKPVNDLSRGALVDDIVYTIALTVIQAQDAARRRAEATKPGKASAKAQARRP